MLSFNPEGSNSSRRSSDLLLALFLSVPSTPSLVMAKTLRRLRKAVVSAVMLAGIVAGGGGMGMRVRCGDELHLSLSMWF